SGTYAILHSFNGSDGVFPFAALVQATDGKLYGTTRVGGTNSLGAFFRIDTSGANFATLHSLAEADGVLPSARLIQASDGKFYGTTSGGGANGLGTSFRIDTAGSITVLRSFAAGEGSGDRGSLVQASDGKLYGTTPGGGTNDMGTTFRIDTSGANF